MYIDMLSSIFFSSCSSTSRIFTRCTRSIGSIVGAAFLESRLVGMFVLIGFHYRVHIGKRMFVIETLDVVFSVCVWLYVVYAIFIRQLKNISRGYNYSFLSSVFFIHQPIASTIITAEPHFVSLPHNDDQAKRGNVVYNSFIHTSAAFSSASGYTIAISRDS